MKTKSVFKIGLVLFFIVLATSNTQARFMEICSTLKSLEKYPSPFIVPNLAGKVWVTFTRPTPDSIPNCDSDSGLLSPEEDEERFAMLMSAFFAELPVQVTVDDQNSTFGTCYISQVKLVKECPF